MDHYIKREDVEKAIATIRKTYLRAKNFNALSAIDCVAGEIRDEVSDIPVFPIDYQEQSTRQTNPPAAPFLVTSSTISKGISVLSSENQPEITSLSS